MGSKDEKQSSKRDSVCEPNDAVHNHSKARVSRTIKGYMAIGCEIKHPIPKFKEPISGRVDPVVSPKGEGEHP